MDKSKLKDTMGRPLTQGLFLEIGYNTQYAVYTLEDEDKTYKGTLYPSLKKLYLKAGDPTEYTFAKAHLLGWQHWRRLNENKALAIHFDDWREELEIAIRSEAILGIIDDSAEDSSFQSKKWLADRGWVKEKVGRPSKQERERDIRVNERVSDALMADVERMSKTGFDA